MYWYCIIPKKQTVPIACTPKISKSESQSYVEQSPAWETQMGETLLLSLDRMDGTGIFAYQLGRKKSTKCKPWEPTTLILSGYDPYIEVLKPTFFMVWGSKWILYNYPTWILGPKKGLGYLEIKGLAQILRCFGFVVSRILGLIDLHTANAYRNCAIYFKMLDRDFKDLCHLILRHRAWFSLKRHPFA